jgi:hypothetical protein
VAGYTINFTATKGAILTPASAVTDASGMAKTVVTAPTITTAYTVTATPTTTLTPAKFNFAEHSVAPIATTLTITSGNNQSSAAGLQLSQTLSVKVTDQYGNPFNGNNVTFTDNGAGGSFSAGNPVTTGADGTATVSYTLPTHASAVTINATATGISSSAVFAETAVAGPAANIVINSGNNQSGTAGTQLPQALAVLVTDQYGNPCSGVSVTFSDGGSGGAFSNANPGNTGADGTVSQFYTLPQIGGATLTITANANGVSSTAFFSENSQ